MGSPGHYRGRGFFIDSRSCPALPSSAVWTSSFPSSAASRLTILAQIGSAIGAGFSYELASVVVRCSDRELKAALDRLGNAGLTLCKRDEAPEAEAHFRRSIRIAREQRARSWELRASTSLARLRYKQGKTAEARGLLEPVYSWFSEGLDTTDLNEAAALLKELC